jgi:hypothetical protein
MDEEARPAETLGGRRPPDDPYLPMTIILAGVFLFTLLAKGMPHGDEWIAWAMVAFLLSVTDLTLAIRYLGRRR